MTYQSTHTGPEVDAAVALLNEVQDIRDESTANKNIAVQSAQSASEDADRAESALGQFDGDITAAQDARDAAEGFRNEAGQHASNADSARAQAVVARTGAQTAETLAVQHKNAAETAAQTATTKASEANTSAGNANTSAQAAENARAAAVVAQGQAANSASSAYESAGFAVSAAGTVGGVVQAAESARDAAAGSASTASTKAGEASSSAGSAASSASTASTKASEASASETNAAQSASTATTKAGEAATSATSASASAGTATTKAGEAAASASTADTARSEAESARNVSVDARDATLGYRNEAEAFRDQAQQAAGDAASSTIDDSTIGTTKGWSSSKILDRLGGATTTAGDLDWNAHTAPGIGPVLLLGSAANGPGGGQYHFVWNLEYGTGRQGNGNITQIAVPYGNQGSVNGGVFWFRGRYSGDWTSWERTFTTVTPPAVAQIPGLAAALAEKVSAQAGYSVPANTKQTQWDTAYGWGNHASAGYATAAALTSGLAGKVGTSDVRLTDSREWSASTVTQATAEGGTNTARFAWTAQRVRQNVAAYTSAFTSAEKTKLSNVGTMANRNVTISTADPSGAATNGDFWVKV